jgi:hypothetical protein
VNENKLMQLSVILSERQRAKNLYLSRLHRSSVRETPHCTQWVQVFFGAARLRMTPAGSVVRGQPTFAGETLEDWNQGECSMDQGCGLGTFLGCGFLLAIIIAFIAMVAEVTSEKRRQRP